jgi:hypothetical protein
MRLSIIGCPDKERFRPYVKRAAVFYAQNLISEKMRENISVKIKFNPKINFHGLAGIVDYNDSKKPRHFEIEINPCIGSHDILETLAHEMVHVKQFVYSETNESLTRWKGSIVPEDIDYYNEPWEIEAYGMSIGLMTKFAIKEKLWEVFDDISNPESEIEIKNIAWKNYPTMC